MQNVPEQPDGEVWSRAFVLAVHTETDILKGYNLIKQDNHKLKGLSARLDVRDVCLPPWQIVDRPVDPLCNMYKLAKSSSVGRAPESS